MAFWRENPIFRPIITFANTFANWRVFILASKKPFSDNTRQHTRQHSSRVGKIRRVLTTFAKSITIAERLIVWRTFKDTYSEKNSFHEK